MNPVPLSSAGLIASRRLLISIALVFLTALNLQAEALPTTARIQSTGMDLEGFPIYRLEWDAVSNATYRVQRAGSLAPGVPWVTVDVVTPVGGTGQYEIKGRSIPENSIEFYRLLLPQPAIIAVEPAVLAPRVAVNLYIVGQCLGSNDVLRINGEPQTNTVLLSPTLMSLLSFTPAVAGTYVFELVVANVVVSSFHVMCADARANPELVVQGPPEEPPAAPRRPVGRITFKAKEGATLARGLTDGGGVRENDNVVFDIQEGKKGLNAVNVKLARMAAVVGGIAGGAVAGMVIAARETDVIPFSGEVQLQVVDLAVEGRGLDFIWARTYRSRRGHHLTLDDRWSFSYDVRCAQNSSGDMDVYDGTGRKDTFKLQTDGVYTCPEFFREGTLTKEVFRLTFADTGYWEFHPLDPAAPDSKLSKVVDRNGNTLSLDYDGSGRLRQIVDDLGRSNIVGYDAAGRIASVTDFSGRTVTYSYYAGEPGGSRGDLKSVTSPPVTGTPNKNDFPEGKTTTYTYSTGYRDERENHLLLSVIDALGQTVSRHAYQHNQTDLNFLRCIAVQRWTNTPARLTYLPQTPTPANQFAVLRCVMNDPVGSVTEYFYDARNRCVQMREFTGQAEPGVPVTDTENRPKGQRRKEDPDGWSTWWRWNNDSQCMLEISPGSQQAQFVYESDFDKSTPARKRADLRVLREVACCGGADLNGDGTMDLTQLVSRYEYDPRFGSDPGLSGSKLVKEISYATIKGNARGPRQSTSLDGTFSHPATSNRKGWDGTIKGNPSGKVISDRDTGRSKGFRFVTSATDPRGNLTTASYDAAGNVINPRAARDNHLQGGVDVITELNLSYNSYGELIAITNAADANGRRRVDTFAYAQGQVVQCVEDAGADGLNLTTTFEYDPRGNMTRVVDPRGNDHLFTYNALNQSVREQTPVNLTARCATDYFYDANDNLVSCATEVRGETDALLGSKVDRCEVDPLHRITRIVSAVDATRSLTNDFVYDGNDQCVLVLGGDAVSGADPFQTVSLQYDERGLLFRQSSAPGSADQTTTQYDYDGNGNLTRVSEGLEGTPRVTTMEYDGFAGFGSSSDRTAGKAKLTDFLGRPHSGLVDFTADGEGKIQFKKADFANGAENLILDWDWRRRGSSHVGRLRAQGSTPLAASLRIVTFPEQWSSCRGASKITDAMGNVTTFNYDANDNLKLVRHSGQTNDVPGADGNIRLAESRYEYDRLDRCVRSRDSFFSPETQAPIGDGERTTTFAYAPNSQRTSVTDDLGRVTSYAYDTVGWLASETSPGGKSVYAVFRDAAGNVARTTQTDHPDLGGAPQVFSWTMVYDSLNRCVSTTDNVGNTASCAYDSLGRIVKTTDPRGLHSFYAHDLLGRQTLAVRDLDGDGLPNFTQDITSMATWSSSSIGRMLTTTDSHGNTTSYAYDSRSRCTNVTYADGTQLKLIWSPRSNLIQDTDANGTVINRAYDLNDRCISNHITPGATVAATTTSEQFAYDGLSRLVSASNDGSESTFAYDSLGNRTRDISGGLGALTTFDSLGNRLSLAYPGGRALTYNYDVLDRCTNIVESGASLASFAYDGAGRVSRISYGNGMRSRIDYNGIIGTQSAPEDFGHGQISRIRHGMTGSPLISDISFAWDRTQNKTKDTPAPAVSPSTLAKTRGYDAAHRLTRATVLSGPTLLRDTIYGLDRMGNRTNVLDAASCSGDYLLDALVPGPMDFQMNQYTATPCDSRSYDGNGNLIARAASADAQLSYSYDYADRLVAVQAIDASTGVPMVIPVAAYAYDALGRRVSKSVFTGGLPPVSTTFLYDGARVIEERENSAVTATFVLDGSRSQDDGVVNSFDWQQVGGPIAMRRGGQDYYFHTDDLGHVLALTGAGGRVAERYQHDDYGAVTFLTSDGVLTTATSSAVGNGYCWGGLRLDAETGLQNNDGGNYLEPQTAQFMSRRGTRRRDPDGLVFNVVNPRRQGSNPSSGGGGSPSAMKPGTVKFFNQAKGFGRFVPTADAGLSQVSRTILKSYFEHGDKPTQEQFTQRVLGVQSDLFNSASGLVR